jgi:hypothetical protein
MKDPHGTMRPERMLDPYLGKWRWVLVGCDWCGVKGRYKTKAEAQAGAKRHNS